MALDFTLQFHVKQSDGAWYAQSNWTFADAIAAERRHLIDAGERIVDFDVVQGSVNKLFGLVSAQ